MPLVHSSVLAWLAERASAAFAGFVHVAALAAVAALWQDALVALALALSLRFALRISAAHRFAAWATAFAVSALLPFLPVLENHAAMIAASPAGGVMVRPWLELDSRWGFAIAAFWLAASAFRAADLVFHSLRLRRLWRRAIPVEAEAHLRSQLASALAARRIEICTTADLDRPSVIGFFAPRILIPDWLYSRLTAGELEQVILHEAEHLRRRDDWTNLLQKFALMLFPLSPAMIWMERRLCREREMACDEGVVERTQAPRTYAACLASLAERGLERREFERRAFLRRAQALSLGVLGRRPELIHRVDSILHRRKALHPLAAGALVGIVGCGLVIGAAELSRSPQLVAFVATPTPDTRLAANMPPETPSIVPISHDRIAEPSVTSADAVFHPSVRYRAVETRSIAPATRNVPSSNVPSSPVAGRPLRSGDSPALVRETTMTERAATPHQVRVNATASTPAATSSQSQEFIVLAAWEEVEASAPQTSARTSREIADYDTSADAQMQSDRPTSGRNASPSGAISVTRLIFFVVPANAATSSTSGDATETKPAHNTSSRSHRPTASAFDGGWLFFQL